MVAASLARGLHAPGDGIQGPRDDDQRSAKWFGKSTGVDDWQYGEPDHNACPKQVTDAKAQPTSARFVLVHAGIVARLFLPPQVIGEFHGDERRVGEVVPEAEAEGKERADGEREQPGNCHEYRDADSPLPGMIEI